MKLFSYRLCISSMCCLIIYFLISCSSIIYSFHIFIYSYYSSIHYHIIYSYSLSNLYLSIQSRTARNPIQNISNIKSQNLGTKSHGLFRPRNNLCHYMAFILKIFQVGKIPYLMELDETPRFWYSCVARDAWINFIS